MADMQKIEDELAAANRIIAQLNPLVGAVEGLAVLAITTARKAGVPVTTFEQQWASWQQSKINLAAALDEFRTKYPTQPPPTTP